MKLKEISKKHYIVVDDSEIKQGDFVYSSDGGIFKRHIDNPCQAVFSISKITHSTQPLEDYTYNLQRADGKTIKVYVKIKPISLSEVKALLGEVDVEKKAEQYSNIKTFDDGNTLYSVSYKTAFITGYNQSHEDNKERKYTEEDFRKAWDLCTSNKDIGYGISFSDLMYSIKSIQPPTEWEVEFVDGKLKLKQ